LKEKKTPSLFRLVRRPTAPPLFTAATATATVSADRRYGEASTPHPEQILRRALLPATETRAPESRCGVLPRHPCRAALGRAAPCRPLAALAGAPLGLGRAALGRHTRGGGRPRRRSGQSASSLFDYCCSLVPTVVTLLNYERMTHSFGTTYALPFYYGIVKLMRGIGWVDFAILCSDAV
jgi:hypothetical protein